ncbi:general stress protein [Rugosimonospora africana]
MPVADPEFNQASMAWNTVTRYTDYAAAQAAVDRLSDDGFPVAELSIVGSDLRLVEKVTGRLTRARAALSGAGTGAWFGLFVGILLSLFTTGHRWLAMVAAGLLVGAVWGALFGFLAHAVTRGRRDFSAVRSLAAAHYDVIATGGQAERARVILGQAGLLPRT